MAHQQQRYRVIEKIASGGMAEVFRAESAGLEGFKKTVAIKRVLPHLSEKKQFMGMFLDEARLSAHLSHSNCVQVFDIGVGDNTYFIVMEYVDGSDLKGVIEHRKRLNQPFPIEEACLICVRICEGLAYAHEVVDGRGESLHIVHRDMSPPNVLITRHGEVKIVDFGLAKANSQLEHSEPGIIKGKFSYLSPEAAQGQPVDHRTDIFAVGIILWELLAGRKLFFGETDLETVRLVQVAKVPPIRQFNPRVSQGLEAVLARALHVDPTQRYQSARDLGRDLNKILFHLGREVSSFDIAQLVLPIWRERLEKRRPQAADRGGSFIGSLIDQALFEFTSLESNERKSQLSNPGAQPLIANYENVQNWAQALGQPQPERPPSGDPGFEVGNLASLEDDAISGHGPVSGAPAPPSEIQPLSSSLPSPRSDDDIDEHVNMRPRRNGLIGVGVALLAVVIVLGAWFGGLFR
jgi:serine/threonine protein kinase